MFKFTFFSVCFDGTHSDLHFLERFSAEAGFWWHFRGSSPAPCPLRKPVVLTQLPGSPPSISVLCCEQPQSTSVAVPLVQALGRERLYCRQEGNGGTTAVSPFVRNESKEMRPKRQGENQAHGQVLCERPGKTLCSCSAHFS